jgi:hypothetical protein
MASTTLILAQAQTRTIGNGHRGRLLLRCAQDRGAALAAGARAARRQRQRLGLQLGVCQVGGLLQRGLRLARARGGRRLTLTLSAGPLRQVGRLPGRRPPPRGRPWPQASLALSCRSCSGPEGEHEARYEYPTLP